MWRSGGDSRAVTSRIARIQDVNRDILLDRRKHRRRVQDLCAKIRQLGGLIKADYFDPAGVRAKIRVSRHHPVNVGPDFNLVGTKSCTDDSSRKIRAAAANGGRNAGTIRADKAAHHRNASLLN